MEGEEGGNDKKPDGEGQLPAAAPVNPAAEDGSHSPAGQEARVKAGTPGNPIHIRDPDLDKWTRRLVGWTCVIAGVALISAFVSFLQWRELQKAGVQTDSTIQQMSRQADAMELAQRAWVAPVKVSLVNPNDAAAPLKAQIFFQNVGREPARAFRNQVFTAYIPAGGLSATQWQTLPAWKTMPNFQSEIMCADIAKKPITDVIYPNALSGSGTFGYTNKEGAPPIPDAQFPLVLNDIKAQRAIYVVAGCVSYESVQKLRFSTFCSFLDPERGGKDIAEWVFSQCPVGNDDW